MALVENDEQPTAMQSVLNEMKSTERSLVSRIEAIGKSVQ
jgi:hypothetical protein